MKQSINNEQLAAMENVVKKKVPSLTYAYIRDLVFASMIGGLILKSVSNGEKVGIIEERVRNHVTWGADEGKEIQQTLRDIERRLDKLEVTLQIHRNEN